MMMLINAGKRKKGSNATNEQPESSTKMKTDFSVKFEMNSDASRHKMKKTDF